MKYYVFYVRGEVAVTETGVEECATEQEAREFVAKLDIWDSWMIVEGRLLDKCNFNLDRIA